MLADVVISGEVTSLLVILLLVLLVIYVLRRL